MKHFTINGKEYLGVKVPTKADRFKIFNDEKPYLSYFLGVETHREYLPFRQKYEIFGLLSKIQNDEGKCRELMGKPAIAPNYSNQLEYISGVECFHSLQQSLKMFTVNPYGNEPDHLVYKYEKFKGEYHFLSERAKNTYADKWEQWNEAQQHVSEYLIVEKIK